MARRAKAAEKKKHNWSQLIMVPINGIGTEDIDTYTVPVPREELLTTVKECLSHAEGRLWIGSGMINLLHYRTIEVADFEPSEEETE